MTEVSISQGITILFIYFGTPILLIWGFILLIRKIKGSKNSGNGLSPIELGEDRKTVMPAWKLLLIVVAIIFGIYYFAGIILGIFLESGIYNPNQ